MSSNIKWVMKNKQDKTYFGPSSFPPVQKDVWKAQLYDSPEEAKSSLNRLLTEKFSASKFEPVKIVLTEEE